MSTAVDLAFVCRVLSVFDGFGRLSNEDVWWRTDGEYAPITLLVNCNDVFWWATSDCEEITPDNIEVLEQAVSDVKAATGSNRCADWLFVCRVRAMRPQGACYDERYIPKPLWPLFDACGPEREVDPGAFGNPRSRPQDTASNSTGA
jgi:hypothetical protein